MTIFELRQEQESANIQVQESLLESYITNTGALVAFFKYQLYIHIKWNNNNGICNTENAIKVPQIFTRTPMDRNNTNCPTDSTGCSSPSYLKSEIIHHINRSEIVYIQPFYKAVKTHQYPAAITLYLSQCDGVICEPERCITAI